MPNYTYTDGETEISVTHSIDWKGTIIGDTGIVMWRKPPENVGINWNGLSPSAAEGVSPEIAQHLRDADRNRDLYEMEHKHE